MRREVKREMSEFECSNGHLMILSKSMGNRCHICGAPCVRMDGMTNKQLAAMEKKDDNWWERELPEKEAEAYLKKLAEDQEMEYLEEGGEESDKEGD
jgi:hypothetical protein